MTVIVALADGDKIYLGGDSAVTSGYQQKIRAVPKVYKRNGFLIGGAGYMVVNQIMAHITTIPPELVDQTPFEYIVNEFLPEFRKAVKSMGQMTICHSRESTGNVFLIAYKGKIFEIGSDMNVFESSDNYLAIGSGSEYALGSLHATEKSGKSPKERVDMALQAAIKFDSFCASPVGIEEA